MWGQVASWNRSWNIFIQNSTTQKWYLVTIWRKNNIFYYPHNILFRVASTGVLFFSKVYRGFQIYRLLINTDNSVTKTGKHIFMITFNSGTLMWLGVFPGTGVSKPPNLSLNQSCLVLFGSRKTIKQYTNLIRIQISHTQVCRKCACSVRNCNRWSVEEAQPDITWNKILNFCIGMVWYQYLHLSQTHW